MILEKELTQNERAKIITQIASLLVTSTVQMIKLLCAYVHTFFST